MNGDEVRPVMDGNNRDGRTSAADQAGEMRHNPVYQPPGQSTAKPSTSGSNVSLPEASPDVPATTTSFYRPEAGAQDQAMAGEMLDQPPAYLPDFVSTGSTIDWSASESITHHKTALWYVSLMAGALVIAAIVYIVSKGDKVTTAFIVIIAGVFSLYAARKPRVLHYRMDGKGITIGQRYYEFERFRSFSIITEGAISGIAFMPLQRLMPLVTVYFVPQDQERIIAMAAQHLPLEEHRHDVIDKFMRKIRF